MPAHRMGVVVTLGLVSLGIVVLLLNRSSEEEQSLLAAATTQEQQQEQEPTLDFSPDTMVGWGEGPEQPILYSHRKHAGIYEINCLYCHTNTDISPVAPMPSVSLCMGCHRLIQAGSPEIQKLRGYEQRGEPIPWERIHKLADFVQFNHSAHIQGGLVCQDCHGPIETMDVVYQYSSLTMGWCLDCHRQPADPERIAEAERVAEMFYLPGRESPGLYPKSIDSDYGVTRGPIDCVACHY